MNDPNKTLTETAQDQEDYKLYNDPSLLEAVREGDAHLRLALEGLKQAERIAEARTDNLSLRLVADAAEIHVREWVARQGLLTQEPKPDEAPGLQTP